MIDLRGKARARHRRLARHRRGDGAPARARRRRRRRSATARRAADAERVVGRAARARRDGGGASRRTSRRARAPRRSSRAARERSAGSTSSSATPGVWPAEDVPRVATWTTSGGCARCARTSTRCSTRARRGAAYHRRRTHRARVEHRRPARRGLPRRLRREQGRGDLVHEVARGGAGAARRHGELASRRAGWTPRWSRGRCAGDGRDAHRRGDPARPHRVAPTTSPVRSCFSARRSRGTSRARS